MSFIAAQVGRSGSKTVLHLMHLHTFTLVTIRSGSDIETFAVLIDIKGPALASKALPLPLQLGCITQAIKMRMNELPSGQGRKLVFGWSQSLVAKTRWLLMQGGETRELPSNKGCDSHQMDLVLICSSSSSRRDELRVV